MDRQRCHFLLNAVAAYWNKGTKTYKTLETHENTIKGVALFESAQIIWLYELKEFGRIHVVYVA